MLWNANILSRRDQFLDIKLQLSFISVSMKKNFVCDFFLLFSCATSRRRRKEGTKKKEFLMSENIKQNTKKSYEIYDFLFFSTFLRLQRETRRNFHSVQLLLCAFDVQKNSFLRSTFSSLFLSSLPHKNHYAIFSKVINTAKIFDIFTTHANCTNFQVKLSPC